VSKKTPLEKVDFYIFSFGALCPLPYISVAMEAKKNKILRFLELFFNL
jgi:hypothetical protein